MAYASHLHSAVRNIKSLRSFLSLDFSLGCLVRAIIEFGRLWIAKNFDFAEFGSYRIWIVQDLDHAEYRSCRVWILQSLDCGEIGS